jgi:hypothetical protein
MLLTDRFTYIHEPKTGGTFVTYVLRELHGGETYIPPSRRIRAGLRVRAPTACFVVERSRASPSLHDGAVTPYGTLYRWNDHGTCNEIPQPWRSKAIVGSVRNPLQTYVSGYLFGWWKRPEYLRLYHRRIPGFQQRFPTFPELSFDEYLEVLHEAWAAWPGHSLHDTDAIGFQSERFLRYYVRPPWLRRETKYELAGIAANREDLLDSRPRQMYNVHFLHTDTLNSDLHDYLLQAGYDADDVEFIRTLGHVIPAGGAAVEVVEQAASDGWQSYYTGDLATTMRAKDRLLFALFPEFDVAVPAPDDGQCASNVAADPRSDQMPNTCK